MASVKIVQEVEYHDKKVTVYELCADSGSTAVISNYGGILMKLIVKEKTGNFRDTVLGFDSIAGYWNENYLKQYPYFGAVIGRYANRISSGAFSLDRQNIRLARNNGTSNLHGGVEGFDKKIWDVVDLKSTPHPSLTMQYVSPSGEEGFPGTLTVNITFTLLPSSFQYHIEAGTDEATAVNLSYHTYFNLDAHQETTANQKVKIHSHHWLGQDDELCVTGNVIPVENSPYDFRNWQPVVQNWNKAGGYDQTFIALTENDQLSVVAEALSSDETLHLQVLSTAPVVHFYNGRWIPVVTGKNNTPYGPFSGYCFETHHYPNAVNIPSFPSTLLRPGMLYRQTNVYKF